VRNLPSRTSLAAIMWLGSSSCCVRSATESLVNDAPDGETSGAYDVVRKCRRGKGTRFVPSLRRSL